MEYRSLCLCVASSPVSGSSQWVSGRMKLDCSPGQCRLCLRLAGETISAVWMPCCAFLQLLQSLSECAFDALLDEGDLLPWSAASFTHVSRVAHLYK